MTAFTEALRRCIDLYFQMGERSARKVMPLHGFVSQSIKGLLGDGYQVISLSEDSTQSREEKVKGLFYDKDVDVAVKRGDRVLGVVSIKFVMSNYGQNANNYFEGLLGECQNLKLANPGLVFWYFFVGFSRVPYFTRAHDIKGPWRDFTGPILTKHKALRDSEVVDNASVSFVDATQVETEWVHPSQYDPARHAALSARCALLDHGIKGLDWESNLHEFVDKIKICP